MRSRPPFPALRLFWPALALFLAGCGGGPSVPALIKALQSQKPEVRADAAQKLGALGEAAKPAIPALIAAMRDRQASVSRAVTEALVRFGEDARPGLLALADDPAAWLRCRAVQTLGRLPSDPSMVAPLMKALEDHDQCVHDKAVEALGRVGDPAVPSLVGSLKNPNPVMRQGAAEALDRMPPEAKERAVFPLVQELRGADEYERGEAELLLSEMGRPAIPSLVELLADPDADLRRRAVVILGRIGRADEGVVTGLMDRLKDPDRLVRLKASLALGNMGERDPRVLPVLSLRMSSSTDKEMKRGLISAIGDMGPGAKDAVGDLKLLLADSDKDIREEASESLMKIGTIEAMDAAERYNRQNLK
jgi:HEAT repeat protein